jgi:hypothetical protein
MNKLVASGAVLLAFTGTAVADDLDGDGLDDITGEAVLTTPEDTSTTTTAEPTSAPAEAAGTEGAKMAIETSLNTIGDIPVVHLLYNLGGNYLDAFVGLSIVNFAPEMGDGATVLSLSLGGGYRLYKEMDGRIHPYMEPYLIFTMTSDGNPDPSPDPISIGAGGMLGVDFQLFDQFTLGASIGGGLEYEIDSPDFGVEGNAFRFGLYTTSINATFWWG